VNLRPLGPSWRELWELHDQVERAFRDLAAPAGATPVWRPATEVLEDEAAYWICFDLPGVSAEQITLEVAEGSLWLSGEKPGAAGEERVLRTERRYGRFGASAPLPRDVAPEEITARLEAGVLTVQVPRRAGAARRKVKVEAG
jgi:HSP20 family protein